MKDRYTQEEWFHSKDRKQFKKERKASQESDRSKFKKTDASRKKEAPDLSQRTDLHRGRVIAISKEHVSVDIDGKEFLCSLKGFMKKERMQAKNLIAVGDIVKILPSTPSEGSILEIEDRYSILSRQDISGKNRQLIAVNIDQLLIIASIVDPPLKPALVDRYLIAAEKGGMHPVIILNKIDLLENAEPQIKELYLAFLAAYEPLGYPILSVSVKTDVGIEPMRALMKDKACVFSGQSGVGKSSLLNAAFAFDLKTGELAQKTSKGSHTTTTSQLLRLPQGGFCIDTPGIRSFGIWDLEKEDLASHFAEFLPFAEKCRYPDCTHLNEPSCAVKTALESGHISALRFESYKNLLEEILAGIDNRTKKKIQEPL